MAATEPHRIVLVTGLSGSGKSIALEALEDCGFYCIDNLPASLFEALAGQVTDQSTPLSRRTALGIDARSPVGDLQRVPGLIGKLRERGIDCEVAYLDADDSVLIQRFSETRRRHPLTDEAIPLDKAIAKERALLRPLLDMASLTVDTSRTTLHELRNLVQARIAGRNSGEMSIMLQSFGFKHGLPRNADFVFDVRCLPNPHWHPELRPYTGRDAPVANFLSGDLQVQAMLSQLSEFLVQWIPCFERDGRSYLTIAIGCTGGQHRSVFLVEALCAFLQAQGRTTVCSHRELV
jgi:RNase adapter protein RapZ